MSFFRPRASGALVVTILLTLVLLPTSASLVLAAPTPASGTISPGDPTVTWDGNISGSTPDLSTCVEDVTCETFTLTVAAGDYTGLRVEVGMYWLLIANDYDLYIHEDDINGGVIASSTDFETNFERAYISFDPPVLAQDRVFAVRAVAFAVTPGDPYAGYASVVPDPQTRVPTYTASNFTFSENVRLVIPVSVQNGEPSVKIDERGNCYVGSIRGVPAGVDAWRFDLDPNSPGFDPGMQNPVYLGQPDAFLQMDPEDHTVGGADGGGDIEMSVSFPDNPADNPVVTITSLAAANISSAISTDLGTNWTLSPAVAAVPADDRQWNESTGNSTVYLVYRAPIPATGLFCAVSQDNGLTYPVTSLISPTGSSPGHMDVDHNNGNVYVSHQNSTTLFVSTSTDGGITWATNSVDNSTSHGQLFDPVRVDSAGNVYVVWSDGADIYMAHSTDEGQNWSDKVRVNDNSVYQTNLLPWLEAGSDGRVAVVWYGTPAPLNGNDADWEVLFAQTLDGRAQDPTFSQQVISDHIIHGSNISTGGLFGNNNRNLIDYFQVTIDPQGAAVVAYTDDHNDYNGHTYVVRQLDGTSLLAGANGNGTVTPASPPALPDPDPADPEVFDFLHDAVTGLLQPIGEDNAFDVLSVDYFCGQDETLGAAVVKATMKVSSLAAIPAEMSHRMSFSSRAVGGVSDRGDQFYLQANWDDPATPVFTWGTTVRNADGSLTYTERGTADIGTWDVAEGTITVGVALTQLNNFTTLGGIHGGVRLHGLRGQTFTPEVNAVRDLTRGGTHCDCPDPTAVEEPVRSTTALPSLGLPMPNPMTGRTSIDFSLPHNGWAELSVFDARGRRVRTLSTGRKPAGRYTMTWDGRTDRFSDAAAGVYYFVLHTPAGRVSQKVVLAH